MKLFASILLCTFMIASNSAEKKTFTTRFHWNQIDFDFQSLTLEQRKHIDSIINSGSYQPSSNVIYGMSFLKNEKLFVSLQNEKLHGNGQRLFTLGYINSTDTANQSPLVTPYLVQETFDVPLKSASVLQIDTCNRLWFVDHSMQQLVVVDLNKNAIIRREPLQTTARNGLLFAAITVDVLDKNSNCDNTYAYIAHTGSFEIIVYRFSDNKQWVISNITFDSTILNDNNTVLIQVFGLSGAALSEPKEDGYRTLYLVCPGTGFVFAVSTQLLQNALINSQQIRLAYKVFGEKGQGTYESQFLYYHEPSGNLFYNLDKHKAIGCWNTKRFPNNLSPETSDVIFLNAGVNSGNVVALREDSQNNLWVNIGNMTTPSDHVYAYSFTMMSASIDDLVRDTKCQPL